MIRKAVFPHRKSNPISKEKLLDVLNSLGDIVLQEDNFDAILASIVQRNLVPGLIYDGFDAFLSEEHARWKSEVQHQEKERIGRKAAAFIQNDMNVFLDAGSTTDEVARIICKKIENRILSRITVATTSVNIAHMISDCCVKMGFDDDFSAVRLYMPGGQVRPNTQAIIPTFGNGPRPIVSLSESVGGFDLGIVGVNGVDIQAGFTTHDNSEALNKKDIITASRALVIIGDSSKIGLRLDRKVADFSDEIQFIVDSNLSEALQTLIKTYPQKIILA